MPVKNGKEVTAKAEVTDVLSVSSYDRSGFAFSSESRYKTGSGAYNEDGTLKSDAIVLYVTNDNAKTITAGIMEAKAKSSIQVFRQLSMHIQRVPARCRNKGT